MQLPCVGGDAPPHVATMYPISLSEPPLSVFRGATRDVLALLDAGDSTNGTWQTTHVQTHSRQRATPRLFSKLASIGPWLGSSCALGPSGINVSVGSTGERELSRPSSKMRKDIRDVRAGGK